MRAWAHHLATFPWATTAHTLRERFREDRLGQTAGSLTFTTLIALVPLLTLTLALFTAFPVFVKWQAALQQWLVESLIPDTIARQVLGYLTQFAGKARRLGGAGALALLLSALALLLTIDRSLNAIWRVRQPHALMQRVGVYWALVTLGPLLLALAASATLNGLAASSGWLGAGLAASLLDALQFIVLALALAALYHFVPNAPVRWAHAMAGGWLAALGLDVARRALVAYLALVPTYSVLYGALASVPILLIWVYLAWVIVLLGAVVAAYLPSLLAGVHRRLPAHGAGFTLALESLAVLAAARSRGAGGLSLPELARALRVDDLALEAPLQALRQIDWAAPLQADALAPRWVLLIDPVITPLAPLAQALLLPQSASTQRLWLQTHWPQTPLTTVLPGVDANALLLSK